MNWSAYWYAIAGGAGTLWILLAWYEKDDSPVRVIQKMGMAILGVALLTGLAAR